LEVIILSSPLITIILRLSFSKLDNRKIIEAYKNAKKSRDICLKHYGDDFPEIALTYNTIGHIASLQGRQEEASESYKKALEIHSKYYDEDHPYIITSHLNISSLLRIQQKWRESLYHTVLALKYNNRRCKKFDQESHPNETAAYFSFGINLREMKNYPEALSCFKKAYVKSKKSLGDNHQFLKNLKWLKGFMDQETALYKQSQEI